MIVLLPIVSVAIEAFTTGAVIGASAALSKRLSR